MVNVFVDSHVFPHGTDLEVVIQVAGCLVVRWGLGGAAIPGMPSLPLRWGNPAGS